MATKKARRTVAFAIIVVLMAFIIMALLPYIKAVLGAIIFYVLFRPLYKWFVKKGVSKNVAAILVMLCSVLVVLIPLFIVLSLVISEVPTVIDGAKGLANNLDNIDKLLQNVSIEEMAQEVLGKAGEFIQGLVVSGFSAAANLMVGLTIMFFLFFFMLVNHKSITRASKKIIPFNKKNTDKLLEEGKNVTYSVVMSTGVVAALQGTMVGVGFYFAGIPGAILWGIIAGVLSFLPVVGTPLVWVPAVIVLLVQGNYVAGIGLGVWGFIITNIDNFIRPIIQKKVGEMHPLISVVGVFIGLPYFGLLGLIMGPLILSYLVLTIQMFQEEYM